MSVEEYEERCELRNKGDPRPDQKRRQLVREAAGFSPERLCLVAAQDALPFTCQCVLVALCLFAVQPACSSSQD